jgi:DedD protein
VRDDEEEDDDFRSGPGWFATLFGAMLLLAAGFAVGVVVGAVREEPAMLLRYVTGKSAAMPAPAASQPATPSLPVPASAPPPAAAPPPQPPSVTSAAEEAAPAAPERVPQPVIAASPPADGRASAATASSSAARYAVQVGAFAQSSEAEKLEAQLKRKGLPAYVQPATGARDSRWRVRIGPLASREEADRVASRLRTQEKLPVWVLEDSG